MTRDELLADRALYGLEAGDEAVADESYDLAAAAVVLASLPIEPMPPGMAERIAAAAEPAAVSVHPQPGWQMPAVSDRAPAPRRRLHPAVTWFATAASLLAIVGVAWWLLRAPAVPTVAQARSELLAAGAATIAWTATPEAPGATGDVVWSPGAQRGYMRFAGLPALDPRVAQYQLWIFDRQRDQAYPVDGGVFDVQPSGETIVAITAKLHVDDATLFAVTVERPGGVVVSKREHIVVTAARS